MCHSVPGFASEQINPFGDIGDANAVSHIKKTKLGSKTLRYQYARSFYYVLPVVNSELHFDFEVSDCHIMVRLHEGPRGEREIPTELVL